MLEELTRIFEVPANGKGLYIKLDISEDTPDEIRSDPVKIRQILSNLIGNSIKFTKTGGITVNAGHSYTSEGRLFLRIEVIDTGIGISSEDLGNLFIRFNQVNDAQLNNTAGTGLGLVISKMLIELMGGEIHVESEVDKGTTFKFSISAEIANGQSDTTQKVDSPVYMNAIKKSKLVLIADDDKTNREMLAKFIEKKGLRHITAENGEQALSIYKEPGVDLVLMDIGMPVMNGLTAASKMREQDLRKKSKAPIIAITAHAASEDKEKCFSAGMDDYISKPVDLEALSRLIDKWMP
ncbi:MAG: response regulator [Clostridiales bacterium]|nr:response regulator [Clostridiales bacterium]